MLANIAERFAALAAELEPNLSHSEPGDLGLGPMPDFLAALGLDLNATLALPREKPKPADVRAAALAIPPSEYRDYHRWFEHMVSLAAVAAEYPDLEAEMRSVMHEASGRPGALTDKMLLTGYDAGANDVLFDKQVAATRKKVAKGEAVRGLGSLYREARQYGWTGPEAEGMDAVGPVTSVHAPALPISAERFNAAARLQVMPPPREWVLGTDMLRGAYALLSAEGGVGKTALTIAWALSLATGRALIGTYVHRRCKVLLISGEDGADELKRRVLAAMQRHNITLEEIDGWLFIVGAREVPGLVLNTTNASGQAVVSEAGFALLANLQRQVGADVIILDPLMSFLPGGVNDNALASAVAGRIVDFLVQRNCAALLVHHHSKAASRNGESTSATAAMGAVGWNNHARNALTLVPATEADAKGWNIPPSELRGVVRLVNSKVNLARKADDRFLKLETEQLPNGDADLGYPNGDRVQVVVPFIPPTSGSLFSDTVLQAVLCRIAEGAPGGAAFSPADNARTNSYKDAVAQVLQPFFPQDTHDGRRKLAVRAVHEAKQRGWLAEQQVRLPRQGGGKGGGRVQPGLVVVWSATPWAADRPPGPHVVTA